VPPNLCVGRAQPSETCYGECIQCADKPRCRRQQIAGGERAGTMAEPERKFRTIWMTRVKCRR